MHVLRRSQERLFSVELNADIASGVPSSVKGRGRVRYSRFRCCGVFAVGKAVLTIAISLVEQIVEFSLTAVRNALVFVLCCFVFLPYPGAGRFYCTHLPVWN